MYIRRMFSPMTLGGCGFPVLLILIIGSLLLATPSNLESRGLFEKHKAYGSAPYLSRRKLPTSVANNNGAVATENEECSKIGVKILRLGGTVVDAAIAASICLGTMNMYSTGLGGGGFMLVLQDGKEVFYDFREAAPYGVVPDDYKRDPKLAIRGGKSVATPGNARGYEAAHKEFGTLAWNRLFAPSISLATKGWPASEYLAKRVEYLFEHVTEDHASYKAFSEFLSPGGVKVKKGSIVRRETYARTLMKIALHGADEFYTGDTAKSIVNTVKNAGGVLTKEDMSSYAVRVGRPIRSVYKGYDIITTPLPTSGGILSFVLKAWNGLKLEGPRNPEKMRRIAEVFKYAYAQRTSYGDVTPETERLFDKQHTEYLSDKYISEVVGSILSTKKTFDPSHYRPKGTIPREHGTTHISVMDKKGNVALITTTINLPFGSMVIDAASGVILNNEIDDFSIKGESNYFRLEESPLNYVASGKRPLSSSAPVIILKDDVPVAALGASGGSHITTAIALVIANYFEFGYDPAEAISLPRIHHQLIPNKITYEDGVEQSIIDYLRAVGHEVEVEDFITGVQMVCNRDKMIEGYSDGRKHGKAASY